MCGRYVSPERAAIERAWQVGRGNSNPFGRRYNVLPTTAIPILVAGALGRARARRGALGPDPVLVEAGKAARLLDQRARRGSGGQADVAPRLAPLALPDPGRGLVRVAARRERADPATGEIRAYKQPHYIFRRDRKPVCFAALLETSPSAQLTCAILTRAASASVSEIHDRMPVVLPDELLVRWVRADVDKAEDVAGMVKLAQSNFAHYAVSTRLNSAKTDDAELLAPIEQ